MPEDRLFNHIPEAMSRLSEGLEVRAQNHLARERFADGVGRPCYEAHFGRDSRCPGCGVDEVLEGRQTGRWYLTHETDGRPSYYEITVAPVLDDAGRVVELVEIIRDATVSFAVEQHLIRNSEELEQQVEERTGELQQLTERTDTLRDELRELRRDQAAIVHTEKMASVGRLAAGLTHEIHTPLGALLSNRDMLSRCLERIGAGAEAAGKAAADGAPTDLARQVETAKKLLGLQQVAGERLHKIVKSLRLFAHLDRAKEEPYDLHEGIDASLALLLHETRGRIEIVCRYGKLPPVLCRPDALNQVFMNLLQNAVQAIDGPGTIEIVTELDGDDVVLTFRDSGKGIAPENLSRILEPGFTTKPRGVGTGLGLAIAHRTLTDHGGSVDVQSELGKGTIFTLRLPVRGGSG